MTGRILLASALLAIVALAPAGADVLVLRDGARLETKGPWEERGAIVVFHRPNGAFSSVPVSEVDLEASREASEPEVGGAEPAEPMTGADGEAAGSASRWTFTDEDIPRAREVPPAPDTAAEPADEEETHETEEPGLAVTSWSADDGESGLVISGEIANHSESAFAEIALEVRLLDREGNLLVDGRAFVGSTVLEGGGTTTFRLPLPDYWSFDRIELDLTGTEFLVGVASSTEASTENRP